MESLFSTETQTAVQFPASLTEIYKPRAIGEFCGIPKVKKICSAFAANPREAALLFVGEPGCGKSSMARCIASQINGEVHTVFGKMQPGNPRESRANLPVRSVWGRLARLRARGS